MTTPKARAVLADLGYYYQTAKSHDSSVEIIKTYIKKISFNVHSC